MRTIASAFLACIVFSFAADARAAASEHPGARLVREANCAACHQIGTAPPREPAPQVGPPLNRAGLRLQTEWLRNFLARPKKLRPGEPARMPSFRLTRGETQTLAAFVASLREPWRGPSSQEPGAVAFGAFYRSLPAGEAKRGRIVFERSECAKCHADPEGKLAPPAPGEESIGPDLKEMARKLTREGLTAVLFDPAAVRPGTKMPSFFYDQGEPLDPDAPRRVADLIAYLEGLAGPRPRMPDRTSDGFAAGARERGQRLALQFNCAGCHAGTGFDPRYPPQVAPPLGYRNTPPVYTRELLAHWIRDPATVRMHERMMGFGRMPTFGFTSEEARAIADWLFSFDGPPGRMGMGMMMMMGRGRGMMGPMR